MASILCLHCKRMCTQTYVGIISSCSHAVGHGKCAINYFRQYRLNHPGQSVKCPKANCMEKINSERDILCNNTEDIEKNLDGIFNEILPIFNANAQNFWQLSENVNGQNEVQSREQLIMARNAAKNLANNFDSPEAWQDFWAVVKDVGKVSMVALFYCIMSLCYLCWIYSPEIAHKLLQPLITLITAPIHRILKQVLEWISNHKSEIFRTISAGLTFLNRAMEY